MCQPKSRGGQRCAAHTRADMQAAATRYADDPSIDNYDALQAARAEYAATPAGKQDLEAQLASAAADGADAVDLAAALRRGALIRERNQAVRASADELDLAARLTGMSPAEVDTELAEKYNALYRLEDQLEYARRSLGYAERDEARALAAGREIPPYRQQEIDRARDTVADYEDKIAAARQALRPYENEYTRRGRWARYFLVVGNGAGGHYHSSMSECSTTFPTTRFAWNPDMSGKTEDEAVVEFGEKMCTCCFPSAPANPAFHAPGRRDRAAVEARAAEKAEKARAAAAKSISMPDGLALLDEDNRPIKTEVAAKRAALSAAWDLKWYSDTHPSAAKWKRVVDHATEAIAHKNGVPVEQVRAEIEQKAEKKYRKDKAQWG